MRYRLVVPAAYAAILSWLAYTPINVPDSVGLAIWFGLPFVAGLLAGKEATTHWRVAVLISVPPAAERRGRDSDLGHNGLRVLRCAGSDRGRLGDRWLVLRDLGRAGAR